MKRNIFATMFMLLAYFVLLGWTLLPNNIFYIQHTTPVYNPKYFTWASVGTIIIIILAVVYLYELGGRIYDKLK